jgi:hypothetical protein
MLWTSPTARVSVVFQPSLLRNTDISAQSSKVPEVESATRAALASISYKNIEYRETLRKAILDHLLLASDILVEYTVQAIQDWIGPDLAQLNDFATFFDLVSHSDRRIQTGALFSLKQRISNREYQESLEKANVVFLIRSLASNGDNPEAISFVAFAGSQRPCKCHPPTVDPRGAPNSPGSIYRNRRYRERVCPREKTST